MLNELKILVSFIKAGKFLKICKNCMRDNETIVAKLESTLETMPAIYINLAQAVNVVDNTASPCMPSSRLRSFSFYCTIFSPFYSVTIANPAAETILL